jgi:prepilin-type N-terminal cleavage/methylation domain-containing protein
MNSSIPSGHGRNGFTLIELLVVITIIAILGAMAMGVVSVLKKKGSRVATQKMMSELTVAMDHYLDRWPGLGDTKAADFRAAPWTYLFTRPKQTPIGPLIDLPMARLVLVSSGVCTAPPRQEKATHIVDYFGNGPDNVVNFSIIEGTANNNSKARYVKAMEMRSSAGTPWRGNDDIIYRFVNALDKETTTCRIGDCGRWIVVDKVIGEWTNPLDVKTNQLDDRELEKLAK